MTELRRHITSSSPFWHLSRGGLRHWNHALLLWRTCAADCKRPAPVSKIVRLLSIGSDMSQEAADCSVGLTAAREAVA
jgi:hypothetical protein